MVQAVRRALDLVALFGGDPNFSSIKYSKLLFLINFNFLARLVLLICQQVLSSLNNE
jgi:hypothetical protein